MTKDTHANSYSYTNYNRIASLRRDAIYAQIPPDWLLDESVLEQNKKRPLDLPETCGLLTSRELRITSLSAVELLRLIHDGTYSAVEVTRAFCKRAAVAHQAVGFSFPRRDIYI